MKRILAAMLIISMTAGMTLQNVKASDEEVYYSESQIESIAQNYTENESLFETINEQIQNIAQKKDTLCRRMYN